MSSLFGIEASRAAQFAIAFAIILVLVALFGLVLRKLTGARLMMPGTDRGRSRQPRLGVVDIYDLDRQRQLVLLRRDNVEHLLLIGGLNDVVIETNIVRVAGARLPAAANEAERLEPAFEQPARPPQVEPSGRPSIETQLAAQLGAFVRRPAEDSDVDQELSAVASVSASVPAHPEPVLKPDAVTVTTAPSVQGLRAEARPSVFPSAPAAAPESVAERQGPRPSFTPPPFQSRPTPTPPLPSAPPVQPPAPPVRPAPPMQPEIVRAPQPAPVERQPPIERPAAAPDAAILSDMAKQLEEALKRPVSPVPPPIAPTPAGPHAAAHEDIADEDDLLEPGPADEEAGAPNETFEEEDLGEKPQPARAPEPPRPAVEPVRPVPPPVEPVVPPAPARAAETPAAPQATPKASDTKAPDPFSVEEIEAEFARLLGRPLDSGKKG